MTCEPNRGRETRAPEPQPQTTSPSVSPLSAFYNSLPSVTRLFQAGIITLTAWGVLRYMGNKMYRKYKGYPDGPFCYPFVGCGPQLLSTKFLVGICGMYGAITYCKLFNQNMIYINDSRAAKHFLFNRKDLLQRFPDFTDQKRPLARLLAMGDTRNVSVMDMPLAGDEWKTRRKFAMTALIRFCDSKFMTRVAHKVMHSQGFEILDQICEKEGTDGNVWDPHDMCHKIAFSTIFHANFGMAETSTQWAVMRNIDTLSETFKLCTVPTFFSPAYNLYKYLLYPKIIAKLEDAFAERKRLYFGMIEKRREHLKLHPEIFGSIEKNECSKYSLCYVDYLLYMLDHVKNNHLNVAKVTNDLAVLFFAGQDTSSVTLQFAMYLLAKTPQLQEMLFEKLKNALGDIDTRGELELSALMACVHFRAFVYELLRLSCAAPTSIPHYLEQDLDVTVDDKRYVLPGNSMVLLNIEYIQRGDSTKEHWKNREYGLMMDDVCLENWMIETNGKWQFEMNESFVSFSTGPRDCLGQQLALKELHLILAYIILNYKLGLVGEAAMDPKSFEIKRKFGFIYSVDNHEGLTVSKR